MTPLYVAQALARDHEREIRSSARGARLAAIAQCCRPSRVAEGIRALRARIAALRVAPCC